MKKAHLCIEIPVWHFYFADDRPEKKEITLKFFDKTKEVDFEVFISGVVIEEIMRAPKEKLHVKKIAKDLLEKLRREKLVLDWRKRQQSRAQVRVTIEDVLDKGLPGIYTPELYNKKCDVIYQHIYDSYYGAGKSAYYSAA